MTVRVVPIADVDAGLREAWADLARDAAEPNPFAEPGTVLPAADLLEGGADVALLVVQDAADLLLTLPVVRRPRFRGVPVPALSGWQHSYSYLGTPLVRRGRLAEAWDDVLGGLRAEPRATPWLTLERLTLDGPVAQALREVLAGRGGSASVLDAFARPVLHRRPECTYLDGRISTRHLKALRRQRRRLGDELGGEVAAVDHAAGADPARLEAALSGMLAQEQAGWKGRAGTAMACRPGDAEYFRRACAAFAAEGRAELWALEAGGRAAAYQANLLAGGTVFHYKIAYDEALRSWSPGLQLELDMVTRFHSDLAQERVDSCVDSDNRVSAQLYPDRQAVGTLLVPTGGPVGTAAVHGARALTSLRARLRSRGTPEPPDTPASPG